MKNVISKNQYFFPSNNPNPVIVISKDFVFKYCNKAAKKELKKAGLVEGKKVPSGMVKYLKQVWKKGKTDNSTFPFVDKFFLLDIVPMKKYGLFFVYATDITEKEKNRNNLKRIEMLYNNVINKNIDPFYICDLNGNFILVNKSFCKLLGYKEKYLLRKGIKDFEANENEKEVKEHIKKVRRNGNDRFESVLRDKNGRKIFVEVSTHYIKEEKIFFVFLRNNSERKKYEEKMREINKKLEKKIKDLEKFNRISVGRELKMIELKKKIKEMEKKMVNK